MKKLLTLFLVIPMLATSACGIEIVDAGETGVKKTLGKVDIDNTYPPGFYIVNPLTTNIIMMNNQVQRLEDTTPVYTKDVQQAGVTWVLNYNLQSAASAKIYVQVGWDWEQKLIPQVINASIKNVIGKWNAIEIVANRDKASMDIEQSIREALADRGITVSKLELTNMDFADEFEHAVEAKVVAVQRAEEAKNTTVRVQEEANQRIIAAEADAKAMQIKTAALKESQSLVLYEAVQKWNGILPQIITGEGGTLLNIPEGALKVSP
jgi:regulator of protease activity HflC (stomatin/prohibitin superfamily)